MAHANNFITGDAKEMEIVLIMNNYVWRLVESMLVSCWLVKMEVPSISWFQAIITETWQPFTEHYNTKKLVLIVDLLFIYSQKVLGK
jgi:hypothetical protein